LGLSAGFEVAVNRQGGGNRFSLDMIRRRNLSKRAPTQDHIHTFLKFDFFAIT
jgi:hypothetical protein